MTSAGCSAVRASTWRSCSRTTRSSGTPSYRWRPMAAASWDSRRIELGAALATQLKAESADDDTVMEEELPSSEAGGGGAEGRQAAARPGTSNSRAAPTVGGKGGAPLQAIGKGGKGGGREEVAGAAIARRRDRRSVVAAGASPTRRRGRTIRRPRPARDSGIPEEEMAERRPAVPSSGGAKDARRRRVRKGRPSSCRVGRRRQAGAVVAAWPDTLRNVTDLTSHEASMDFGSNLVRSVRRSPRRRPHARR